MTAFPAGWAPFLEGPIFVFTSDQDWAPEWAAEFFLSELRELRIPLHIFRTNRSHAFDRAVDAGEIEQGWHPNFLPGSSQGGSVEEVIRYCQDTFPRVTTVRSHCFSEDTFSWRALRAAGIVADSQVVTRFQSHLLPIVHWTGILRFPVYFEDDIFFDIHESRLDLDAIMPTLFTPGLKIVNFHPTFVACNTPARSYHESLKPRIFSENSTKADVRWKGRGTATVLRELAERILSRGHHFQRFQTVVDLALTSLQNRDSDIIPVVK